MYELASNGCVSRIYSRSHLVLPPYDKSTIEPFYSNILTRADHQRRQIWKDAVCDYNNLLELDESC